MQGEIHKTVRDVTSCDRDNKLIFTLLTDTHYVINGNWDDTAACIEAVNKEIKPDGIIHLGDFTDGILGKNICDDYSHRVINRIKEQNIPLYITIGNHDSNYFRNNKELLSAGEQYNLYISKDVDKDLVNEENTPWYYKDFED